VRVVPASAAQLGRARAETLWIEGLDDLPAAVALAARLARLRATETPLAKLRVALCAARRSWRSIDRALRGRCCSRSR